VHGVPPQHPHVRRQAVPVGHQHVDAETDDIIIVLKGWLRAQLEAGGWRIVRWLREDMLLVGLAPMGGARLFISRSNTTYIYYMQKTLFKSRKQDHGFIIFSSLNIQNLFAILHTSILLKA
jgi:hypothetical protein